MSPSSRWVTAGQNEGIQRRQLVLDGVDLRLQALARCSREGFQMLGGGRSRCGGKPGTGVQQIGLNLQQFCSDGIGGLNRRQGGCDCAGQGIDFVKIAIGFDAGIALIDALSGKEAGFTAVTRARVDFHVRRSLPVSRSPPSSISSKSFLGAPQIGQTWGGSSPTWI